MKFKEQFVGAFESALLALVMVWTIGISVALIHPQPVRERSGVVEIYSLTPVASSRAGV